MSKEERQMGAAAAPPPPDGAFVFFAAADAAVAFTTDRGRVVDAANDSVLKDCSIVAG